MKPKGRSNILKQCYQCARYTDSFVYAPKEISSTTEQFMCTHCFVVRVASRAEELNNVIWVDFKTRKRVA